MGWHDRQERKHRMESLRQLALVARCTDRQLARIDQLGASLAVQPESMLTNEGTPGRECFVIVGGSAVVRHDERTIGAIAAGSVAGELALLDGTLRSATVVATTPMQLLVLTPEEFGELLDIAPCVADQVLEVADRRRAELAAGA